MGTEVGLEDMGAELAVRTRRTIDQETAGEARI